MPRTPRPSAPADPRVLLVDRPGAPQSELRHRPRGAAALHVRLPRARSSSMPCSAGSSPAGSTGGCAKRRASPTAPARRSTSAGWPARSRATPASRPTRRRCAVVTCSRSSTRAVTRPCRRRTGRREGVAHARLRAQLRDRRPDCACGAQLATLRPARRYLRPVRAGRRRHQQRGRARGRRAFVRPSDATVVVVGDATVCRGPLEAIGRPVVLAAPEF